MTSARESDGTQAPPTEQLPRIPDRVIMRDGQEVSLAGEIWRAQLNVRLGKTLIINWGQMRDVRSAVSGRSVLSGRAVHLQMLYISSLLMNRTANTAKQSYNSLLGFARWLAQNGACSIRR